MLRGIIAHRKWWARERRRIVVNTLKWRDNQDRNCIGLASDFHRTVLRRDGGLTGRAVGRDWVSAASGELSVMRQERLLRELAWNYDSEPKTNHARIAGNLRMRIAKHHLSVYLRQLLMDTKS